MPNEKNKERGKRDPKKKNDLPPLQTPPDPPVPNRAHTEI